MEAGPLDTGRLLSEHEIISRFATIMQRPGAMDDLLWTVTRTAGRLLALQELGFYLRESGDRLRQRAIYSLKDPDVQVIKNPIVVPLGEGIVGTAAKTGLTALTRDVDPDDMDLDNNSRDDLYPDKTFQTPALQSRWALTVPVMYNDEVVGVFDARSSRGNGETDLEILQLLARISAPRIALASKEDALVRSQRGFRLLIEENPDPVLVHDGTRLLNVNQATLDLFGYEREELLQLPMQALVLPADLAVLSRRQVILARGDDPGDEEISCVHKNGSVIILEIHAHITTFNDQRAVIVIGRNVTHRKAMAKKFHHDLEQQVEIRTRELKVSQDELTDTLAEAHRAARLVKLGTFEWDWTEDRLASCSEEYAGFWEMTVEEAMQTFINSDADYSYIHPDDRDRHKEIAHAALANKQNYTIAFRLLLPSGRIRHLHEVCEFVFDDKGEIVRILGSVQDVTEKVEMEEKFREAQKMEAIGQLAGGIAHDFNNILMIIRGNSELAKMELPELSPTHDRLDLIVSSCQRAAELCQQMLAYAGKGSLVMQLLDLSRLVEEMSHLLEVAVPKSITLKRDFGNQIPLAKVDPSQIRQVVMNLIINAAEAIGDQPGVVSINIGSIHCGPGYFNAAYIGEELPVGYYSYIEITDSGCGMSSDTKAKLFEPFFTTKFTGRGLGLSAVLGIVRSHKGALELHSEEGMGTTIRVLFPAQEGSGSDLSADALTINEKWTGNGTILLVDDEESIIAVTEEMLKSKGYKVLTAKNGGECVELFRAHNEEIACVVLDYMMPLMDGEAAYRELRSIKNNVNVILVSGYSHEDISARFHGEGKVNFLQKPYGPGELGDMLRKVLSK